MKTVRIAPLVEGDGEVEALPVLLRRIAQRIDVSIDASVPPGFRHPSGSLLREGGLERAINAVAVLHPEHAVLVLIDCEDDCPRILGQSLLGRARAARPDLRVSVVLAHREYEAWFLASAESLSGKRGLRLELAAPADPENIRDAKGWLTRCMPHGSRYSPTQDQSALSQLFDLDLALARSRSFQKLYKEVELILKHQSDQDSGS